MTSYKIPGWKFPLMALLAVCLLTATSCAMFKKNADSMKSNPLTGTNWELQSITGFQLEENMQKPASLGFSDTAMRVSGKGGCNGFGGDYTLKGNTLKFGEMMSTMMYCEHGSKTEKAYLKALAQVDAYKTEDGKLYLLSGENILLEFKAMATN